MNVSVLRTHHTNLKNITCLDLLSCIHFDSQIFADFENNFFNEDEVRLPVLYKR
jgi:hypothetical protein